MKIRQTLIAVLLAMALVVVPVGSVFAATTADVTVTATPAYISISVSPTSYNFGLVAPNADVRTPTTTYFTLTNNSNVVTNHTIGVTSATWTGGTAWNHSETGDPGPNTAALRARRGGDWGADDVIVKNASPNNIATNQPAGQGYEFGLRLRAPTTFQDGAQKSNTVRITATQA